jgi:transposase
MKKTKKTAPRRHYDEDFKRDALRLVEDGRTVKDVAEGLGISSSVLYAWRSQSTDTSTKEDTSKQTELNDLRKRLREVEQERDILKKALSIFSRKT